MIVAPASMHASASFVCSSTVAGTLGLRRRVVTPLSATSIITGVSAAGGSVRVSLMWVACHAVRTRITELLGIEHPIVQAPMGFIARAQLASAVSNAGGLGIIETSSGQLSEVRDEIVKMRELTDKPFGVNVAQLFIRDAEHRRLHRRQRCVVRDHVGGRSDEVHQGAQGRGYHRVPRRPFTPRRVEGGRRRCRRPGGGRQRGRRVQGADRCIDDGAVAADRVAVDVPIIAAGGVCDGRSMAAALVLGAEGVQMGTRMVSAAESPVHDNWKNLICSSNEGDTLLLNRNSPPAFRVLRTGFSEAAEGEGRAVIPQLESVRDLYFGGNLEASFAFSGQVAGRITEVIPVAQILDETITECEMVLREISERYAG